MYGGGNQKGNDIVLSELGVVQWNLSVTTTSLIKFIACDLFINVF